MTRDREMIHNKKEDDEAAAKYISNMHEWNLPVLPEEIVVTLLEKRIEWVKEYWRDVKEYSDWQRKRRKNIRVAK